MGWFFLLAAGFFEIVWLVSMKYSIGFTNFFYTTVTLSTSVLSFFLLSQSLKEIPAGTAYVVWTGIGTVGTAIVGIFIFNEPKNILRIVSLLLVIIGIIGLKLSSNL